MKSITRTALSAGALVAGIGFVLRFLTPVIYGHGSEARYVQEVAWEKPHVARTYGLSYSELGIGASRGRIELRTLQGRTCVSGSVIGFDIDDQYAFDIDEQVTLKLTYAPEFTRPFTVYWDANGGTGLGRSAEIASDAGAPLREVTLTLERARFAGQGTRNIDIAVGNRNGLTLCDLQITRSNTTKPATATGMLRLELRDATSRRPVPARVGLYDSSGRLPLPSERALLVHRFSDEVRRLWASPRAFWPTPNRQIFYADGRYDARVPAGRYDLVVTRGLEYRAYRNTIEVQPNQTTAVTVDLERYADLPARGWYSGDGHVHLGRDVVRDRQSWTHLAAEDVHLANLLQMGNIAGTHFTQPAWGAAGQFLHDGHVLVSGQEDPRTVHHGHTIHHNLQRAIHPRAREYFLYQHTFEEARRQGGFSGYAHHGELFNGRRGLALDVPFGIVDFIEVLQNGRLATEGWYAFLNLGYKILPDAGSDYPYMDFPGVVRNYARVDGTFNADAWFKAFRQGAVYVTNGPFLDFTVNGQPMGAEVRVGTNSSLEIVATADINPDVDTLDRLELVAHGEVIATERAGGGNRVTLRTSIPADRSKWLAVRAWGERQESNNMTVAHSAPIYVVVDGQPFWKAEAVPQIVAQQTARLDEMMTAAVDPNGDLEPWETRPTLEREWKEQRVALKPRVEEARSRYRTLVERASRRSAGPAPAVLSLAGFATLLWISRRGRLRSSAPKRPQASAGRASMA